MSTLDDASEPLRHSHVFLGEGHEQAERRTWGVIALCSAMMVAEIAGGALFGSIALIADGLHMSTHASALLLAAVAYRYARRHAHDSRFSFGTGKLGDLAGYTSAIVLAMIAVLIGYEAVTRFVAPVPIRFGEAIPIACLGLVVNVLSVWLLSGSGHEHHHHHRHGKEGRGPGAEADEHRIPLEAGAMILTIHEDGVPPRFRVGFEDTTPPPDVTVETERPDGARQTFAMMERAGYFESADEVPEPHAFIARVIQGAGPSHPVLFAEHEHVNGTAHRDNNLRAAVIHVMGDAAVSMLVILGLVLARLFGWVWMDPLAGLVGALVIAAWSYGLIRDTGAIMLDMTPDRRMAEDLRCAIEGDGDRLADLHLWRLGPGHLAAIVSVVTKRHRGPDYYRRHLRRFRALSHVTVEVRERT